MIKDTIKNYTTYLGISDLLDKALIHAAETDLTELPLGKHTIAGDKLFVAIMEYDTKSEALLEAHRSYIDIQIPVSGSECFEYCELTGLEPAGVFDTAKDIGFYNGHGDRMTLQQGEFAIFFPQDAHKPGLQATAAANETSQRVRKAVYKVAVSD